jgi:hypothetical protein
MVGVSAAIVQNLFPLPFLGEDIPSYSVGILGSTIITTPKFKFIAQLTIRSLLLVLN